MPSETRLESKAASRIMVSASGSRGDLEAQLGFSWRLRENKG